MKRILILLTIFLCQFSLQGQEIANVEKVTLSSKVLNQDRPILIYTPKLYEDTKLVNFDVIYVFDSQNRELFDLAHSLIRFTDLSQRFIVVGIASPYYEETDYARNHDYLPEPVNVERKDFFGGYCCNSGNLKKFVTDEVMPYINKNYRTTKKRIGVGHSLSASFVLDSLLTNDMFDAYLAISPNFAYDKQQLANSFIGFDFNKLKGNRFVYISHGNENWAGWRESREKVYSFLNDAKKNATNLVGEIGSFPEEDHWYVYLPALRDGLKKYFAYEKSRHDLLSDGKHRVTIRVKVPSADNKVFIKGNQTALGNSNPSLVELKKVADNIREITLELQAPARFQFTRGSMETRAIVKGVFAFEPIVIDPSEKKLFEFEVSGWLDDDEG